MTAGNVIKHVLGRLLPRQFIVAGKRRPDRRIALTFDDGPHPVHTPLILDILARYSAKATFFLQGLEAEKHPALVRRLHAEGHELGNHGYAHRDARETPINEYLDDASHAQRVLEDIVGAALPRLFRPPYGNLTARTLVVLIARGYRITLWSVDLNDSFITSAPELVAHARSLAIRPGQVLLLHEDYAHTVKALPEILGYLADRKHAFATVSGL